MTIGERILILSVVIGVPLTFVGVLIFAFTGGIQKFALRPLQRRFSGLDLHEYPQTGDVSFVYHTYRGLFAWLIQEEHRISAPANDARILLKRLLYFNLTWGMLSCGLVFVPFVALGNYYAQKRSIERQELTLETTEVEIEEGL